MNDEQKELALRMLQSGEKPGKISKELGLKPALIYQFAHEMRKAGKLTAPKQGQKKHEKNAPRPQKAPNHAPKPTTNGGGGTHRRHTFAALRALEEAGGVPGARADRPRSREHGAGSAALAQVAG